MLPRCLFLAATVLVLSLAAGCDPTTAARETEGAASPASTSPAGGEAAKKADSQPPQEAASATAAAAADEAVIEATFDDIKFAMEKTEKFERSMLTAKVQSLFGKRIRIRGYIYPTLRRRGLTQLVLVRDNMECCFGPGAALFDCIVVTMAAGKTAEYSIRPVAAEGVFRLEEMPGPDGRPLAIYQMVADSVQ